jgi:hypothetical protein
MEILKSSVQNIGVEEAKSLLADTNRVKNRSISDRVVEKYAQDLVKGNWCLNGESIIKHADGTLLDGQHRMLAVAKSGAAMTTNVVIVSGDKFEILKTLDGGRSRKATDYFTINGTPYAKILPAALLLYWKYENGSLRNNMTTSTNELVEVHEKNPGLLDSVKAVKRVQFDDLIGLVPVSVLAFLHYLFGKANSTLRDEFFDRLTGVLAAPAGTPEYALRRRLVKLREMKNRDKAMKIGLAIKAWNVRFAGDSCVRLNWKAGCEFPTVKGLGL